ncbi:MAG TPA: hypothetical protein VJ841_01490 [Candidatus Saccharimonadales bacterium]|nr:hypothetical protein [Candidatus Saccharimonadales bacterium]
MKSGVGTSGGTYTTSLTVSAGWELQRRSHDDAMILLDTDPWCSVFGRSAHARRRDNCRYGLHRASLPP